MTPGLENSFLSFDTMLFPLKMYHFCSSFSSSCSLLIVCLVIPSFSGVKRFGSWWKETSIKCLEILTPAYNQDPYTRRGPEKCSFNLITRSDDSLRHMSKLEELTTRESGIAFPQSLTQFYRIICFNEWFTIYLEHFPTLVKKSNLKFIFIKFYAY